MLWKIQSVINQVGPVWMKFVSKAFVVFSDHVGLFHGSPSVLEVDVGPVLEGVICSDFTPAALSKFVNPFYKLPRLLICPHLQHRREVSLEWRPRGGLSAGALTFLLWLDVEKLSLCDPFRGEKD